MNRRKTAPKMSPTVDMWQQKFNALCYEVFHRNPKGKELLEHLELKHFRSPVANPAQDASWGYFNEGKNELIRSFTHAIMQHMKQTNRNQKTGNKVNV